MYHCLWFPLVASFASSFIAGLSASFYPLPFLHFITAYFLSCFLLQLIHCSFLLLLFTCPFTTCFVTFLPLRGNDVLLFFFFHLSLCPASDVTVILFLSFRHLRHITLFLPSTTNAYFFSRILYNAHEEY